MESLLTQLQSWYVRIKNLYDNCVCNMENWLASSLPIIKGMLESHWLKAQNIYEAILLDYGDDDQVMTMIEGTQERAIACYGEASRRISARMDELEPRASVALRH